MHVDGRYNSREESDAHIIHITQGYSRDHRPDRNHVRLDLIVEHQAGIPVLMKPRSGHTNDGRDFGPVVTHPMAHLQTAPGLAYLVADSALYRAENLQTFTQTRLKWITRVPATLTEAQDALAQADLAAMLPLMEGYREQLLASHDGGMAQRWVLIYAARRRPQAQRTVDKHWLKQRTAAAKAFQKLCRTAFACEAEAQQALRAFTQALQATRLQEVTIRPASRYAKRGRPGNTMPPTPLVYHVDGAMTSSLATRHALVAQHSCVLLAPNDLDSPTLSPLELLEGDKGQQYAERGFRFLKDPLLLASSRYRKKPQRIMALLMVMTVCLLVYAALESRIRQALKAQQTTCPTHKGQPVQNPTARWVFQSFVGSHLLRMPGAGALVLHLRDQHRQLLRILGHSYEVFYS